MKQSKTKDLYWGYAAQIFQFGAGVFVLPYVLHKLPTNQIAIWYIYTTLMSFVALLDFGFSGTIAINVSYIFSGATKLSPEGIADQITLDHPNYALLKSIIITVKKIYRKISLTAFLVMGSVGSLYIHSISGKEVESKTLAISWMIVVLSITLNVYFTYYESLLIGSGKISAFKRIAIMSKIVYICTSYLTLFFGCGLIGLAVSNIANVLVVRILSYYAFYTPENKKLIELESETQDLFPVLWTNAKKSGIVAVGAFAITKANLFFVAAFLPLAQAAKFGLASQVIGFISGIANTAFYTLAPSLNGYRITNNLEGLKKGFAAGLFLLIIVFLLAGFPLLLFGNKMLILLGSKTVLPSMAAVGWMLVTAFLESNHSISAGMITTGNTIPYVKPSIFSGVAVVIATFAMLRFTNFGIFGVIGAQFAVQLCYNNWKWPHEMLKSISSNYCELLRIALSLVKEKCTRKT